MFALDITEKGLGWSHQKRPHDHPDIANYLMLSVVCTSHTSQVNKPQGSSTFVSSLEPRSCGCGHVSVAMPGTAVPNGAIRNPNVEIPGPDLAFKECGPELVLRNTAATTLWPSDVAPGQAETNSNLECSNQKQRVHVLQPQN